MRTQRFVGCLALVAGVSVMGWAAPAAAQEGNFYLTESWEEVLEFLPSTTTSIHTDNFTTQVLGRLNGVVVYDESFAAAANSAQVLGGFDTARLTITALGGPGVLIGDPHLISSTTTTSSSSANLYSLVGTSTVIQPGVLTFGPGSIVVGQISECDVSALPSATQPTCTALPGDPIVLTDRDSDINVHSITTYTIATETTTTVTTETSEVWAIDGVLRQVGSAHPAAQMAAFDVSDVFLGRLLGVGGWGAAPELSAGPGPGSDGSRWSGFVEGTGLRGQLGQSNTMPGSRYSHAGARGGFTYRAGPDLSLGVVAQFGDTSWNLDEAGVRERAWGDDLRIGAVASWTPGPWRLALGGFGGRQRIDTATTVFAAAGASTAHYTAEVSGAGAAASYAFRFGEVTVTPRADIAWLRWSSPAYSETGGLLPFDVEAADRRQTRAGVGLSIDRDFALGDGATLTLGGGARGFVIDGDRTGFTTATYAGVGGTPFGIETPGHGRYGVELTGYGDYRVYGNLAITASVEARAMEEGYAYSGRAGVRFTF